MTSRTKQIECPACHGTGHCTVRGRVASRTLRYIEGLRCQVCDGTGRREVRAERFLSRLRFPELRRHLRDLAAQAPIRWPLRARGLAVIDARNRTVCRFECTAGRYQWEERHAEAVAGLLNAAPVLLRLLDAVHADDETRK